MLQKPYFLALLINSLIISWVQEAWFTNLVPNTVYYFKMYGYTGTGSGINYKTDGGIPQVEMSTSP